MPHIILVTSNPDKASEATRILGTDIDWRDLEIPEIQSLDLREIVQAKADFAYAHFQCPVLVEDVSFSLEALGGFPGTFVKFWEKSVGYDQAVKIAEALGEKKASARCGVGYQDGKKFIYTEGITQGNLVKKTEGEGFGFDYYFVPEGSKQTFSEMGRETKNRFSHRAQGFEAMRKEIQLLQTERGRELQNSKK